MTRFLAFVVLLTLTFQVSAANFGGTFTTDFGDGVTSITMNIDDQTNMVHFSATGPANAYFAFGFDATTMSAGTYVFVLNETTGSVSERSLGAFSAGSELTATVTNVTSSVEGDQITIEWDRSLSGSSAEYYDFAAAETTINMIYAKGGSQTFAYHNANRGKSTFAVEEIETSMSVGEVDKTPTISMFPNPASNQLNLKFDETQPSIAGRILDLKGATVGTLTEVRGANQAQVDISNLPAGTYVLEFATPSHQGQYIFLKK